MARFLFILFTLTFGFTSIGLTAKSKTETISPTLFHSIPNLIHGGGAFPKVPEAAAKKIEAVRKKLFSESSKITSKGNVIVLNFSDDLGENYVLLMFSADGKLLAGISNYEKYGQCYKWEIKELLVTTTCSGSEGGENWKYDIIFDFKKMVGTVVQKD